MSEYKHDFKLHTETLAEAGLRLVMADDEYGTHLAHELLAALEQSDVDESRYEDLKAGVYDE